MSSPEPLPHGSLPNVLEKLFAYLRYQKKAFEKLNVVSFDMEDAFEELMMEMNDYLFSQIEENRSKKEEELAVLEKSTDNDHLPDAKRKKVDVHQISQPQSIVSETAQVNYTESEIPFETGENITLQLYEEERTTVENNQHIELQNQEESTETYVCLICSDEFGTTGELQNHTKESHEECMIEGHLQCDICGILFSDVQDLKKHELEHAERNRRKTNQPHEYIVNQDVLSNISKDEIDQYIENLKPEDCCDSPGETHPYCCKFCDSRCTTFPVLVQHLVEHSNAKLYKCSYCNSLYKTKKILTNHIKSVHLKVKTFVCNICNKNFGKHGTLKEHMLLHTGEKPFPCDVCGERFHSRSQRSKHRRKLKHFNNTSANKN